MRSKRRSNPPGANTHSSRAGTAPKLASVCGVCRGANAPCPTGGDNLVPELERHLPGEDVETLPVRRMHVQRGPRAARGELHLHDGERVVGVICREQDPQGIRRPGAHDPSRHLDFRHGFSILRAAGRAF